MKKVSCLMMLLGGLAWSAPAQASTITFGFGGTAGFNENGQFVTVGPREIQSGLTLQVSPWSEGGTASSWRIDSTAGGYGVDNGVCVIAVCDDENVDSDNNFDGLTFTFNQNVTLTQVMFSNWIHGDKVRYRIGGPPPPDGGFTVYDGGNKHLELNLDGNQFFFGAINESNGSTSEWRVDSLDYTYAAAQTAQTAVPEPMSLALLGSGLAGLAARRRRRRKA